MKDELLSALMSQSSAISQLKRYGTQTSYLLPPFNDCDNVLLIGFAHASHYGVSRQLLFIIGLVFGSAQKGFLMHLLNWASQKSRRPARSTPTAEILADVESLDDVVSIRNTIAVIIEAGVRLSVVVDSTDLYGPLSSRRDPTDKSVRGDVNSICFYYETAVDLLG